MQMLIYLFHVNVSEDSHTDLYVTVCLSLSTCTTKVYNCMCKQAN